MQEGDRIVEEHGENTVVTPSKHVPFNFGPASFKDSIVHTCERPGGDTEGGKIDTRHKVREWVDFMSPPPRGIKHVVVLLDEEELAAYDEPGLIQAYEECGITVHHIPLASENSFSRIMATLEEIEKADERAVAHCSHGMGRSGRVAAGWLVHRYGLKVSEAVDEALAAARTHGVERMGSPLQLEKWIESG